MTGKTPESGDGGDRGDRDFLLIAAVGGAGADICAGGGDVAGGGLKTVSSSGETVATAILINLFKLEFECNGDIV
ncbi:hypothetical protein [Prochlorothrix hollandica]|uniref:Uncharacterized protein n=1 Tax=Prochlorothrix hollandica PCC 9006 = CALU 1027 TaxID=317619 RepID=A0A0M2Q0C3_PROHO|nr:hypothetical protein [Prochlorothrix hollandica]KKJ00092.1 hypothetical protein PROH_10135 [Prochlorothrix hollandica PCC 9006 = CALU 1027]